VYSHNADRLNAIFDLHKFFAKEQLFIDTYVETKLLKEFLKELHLDESQALFVHKFRVSLMRLLEKRKPLIDQIFKGHEDQVIEKLLFQALREYKEKLLAESIQQGDNEFLPIIGELVPHIRDQKVLDTAVLPFFKEFLERNNDKLR